MSSVINSVTVIFIFSIISFGSGKIKNLEDKHTSILPATDFDYEKFFEIGKWFDRYYNIEDDFERYINNKCVTSEFSLNPEQKNNVNVILTVTSTQTGKKSIIKYNGHLSPDKKIIHIEPIDPQVQWTDMKTWIILVNKTGQSSDAWYVVLYHSAIDQNLPGDILESIRIYTSSRHVKVNLKEIQKLLKSKGINVKFGHAINEDCNEK